jgi:beta-N-acetylhexosaminidase
MRLARTVLAGVVLLALAGCTATVTPHSVRTVVLPSLSPVTSDPIERYADDRLATMSLREEIASMLMLHYPGTATSPIRDFVARYHPGGLILMGDNVPAKASDLADMIPALSGDAGLPIVVGIDQEGGVVRRIDSDTEPAGAELRALPVDATRKAFAARGALLGSLGVSVNFGIVADETDDPSSFIYSRILGTTPADAAARVTAAVKGESGEVFSTLKHFPGHGVAEADSHSSIPSTDMSLAHWRTTHAVPFEAGIDAGAEFVMFGHLRFSSVDDAPASLSTRWHEILRDELGFTGIIITDDMLMLQYSGEDDLGNPSENAIAAIAAGTTMLLYVLPADPSTVGINIDGLITDVAAAVEDGRIPRSVINDAAHRLLELRRGMSGQTGAFAGCTGSCVELPG